MYRCQRIGYNLTLADGRWSQFDPVKFKHRKFKIKEKNVKITLREVKLISSWASEG
jgi:hypothetical protein